jgi:hypothetical protein
LGKAEFDGLPAHYFTPPDRLEAAGRQLFADLAAENYLKDLSPENFSPRLANYFSRQNQDHYFREGNGRTQRLVWEYVAREAGHDLSFEGISRERMIVASIDASKGDNSKLVRMFNELLDPLRALALRQATGFFEKHRSEHFDWHVRYVATTTPGQRYDGTFFDSNKNNFIMHDGQRLFIGDARDLPTDGRSLEAGSKLSVVARDYRDQRREWNVGKKEPDATPTFKEAIPAGRYTGLIKSVDGERILQKVGEEMVSHRRASKRQGDDALLKPGRIATISYGVGSWWDISDPNVQSLGRGRGKGLGLGRR